MATLLSLHVIAIKHGDGLLPELAAILERPIPKVAEPVDALPNSQAPLKLTVSNSPPAVARVAPAPQ